MISQSVGFGSGLALFWAEAFGFDLDPFRFITSNYGFQKHSYYFNNLTLVLYHLQFCRPLN